MELMVGNTYAASFGEGTETPGEKLEFRVVSKNKRGQAQDGAAQGSGEDDHEGAVARRGDREARG